MAVVGKDSLNLMMRIQNPKQDAEEKWTGCGLKHKRVSINIQSHSFLSVAHSWGNASYLHSHSQPIVWLNHPEVATSGQLERGRDENSKPGPTGNSACALQWGEKRRARSGFWCRAESFRCLSCLLILTAVRQLFLEIVLQWWDEILLYSRYQMMYLLVYQANFMADFVMLLFTGSIWMGKTNVVQ